MKIEIIDNDNNLIVELDLASNPYKVSEIINFKNQEYKIAGIEHFISKRPSGEYKNVVSVTVELLKD